MAEASGLLNLANPTIRHARAVNFLRQTIHIVAPTHPSLPHIIRTVHELRVGALSDPEAFNEEYWWDNPLHDIAVQDARYAVSANSDSPCQITDDELAVHFAWTPTLGTKSAEHFASLCSRHWIAAEMVPGALYLHSTNVGLLLARSLVRLRQIGECWRALSLLRLFP